MAKLNEKGNILANCVYCDGALTTFIVDKTGVSITKGRRPNSRMIESDVDIQHRFFYLQFMWIGGSWFNQNEI